MEEQQVRLLARRGHPRAVQPVVANAGRQRITERLGEQLAHPLQRVLLARHGVTPVIEARGQRLAGRITVQASHRRLDVAGQPGAFQQPLGVDHQVVARFAQARLEAPPFTGTQGLPRALAPATDGHRNHLIHRRMPGGNLGEAFLHHPVEADAGYGPLCVGERR